MSRSTTFSLYKVHFVAGDTQRTYFKAGETQQQVIDQAAVAFEEDPVFKHRSFDGVDYFDSLECIGEITLEYSAESELQLALFGLLSHIVEMGAQNLVDFAPGSPYAVARELLTDEQKAILKVDEEAIRS